MESLEERAQPCVYLPPEDDEYGHNAFDPEPLQPSKWRDLPDGYERRMYHYKKAWSKCLHYMQRLVHALHKPVATELAQAIKSAYTGQLPGLPYPEIPVITLSADSGSRFYADVVSHLEAPQDGTDHATGSVLNGGGQAFPSLQVHLHPADCPNLLSMMRALVVGFTTPLGVSERKVRPAASLANFDIARLEAWYRALDDQPKLIVFLHEFEQFDVAVVQDAFYICSLHVPRVPLVFVLGLTSPSSLTYLHKAYSRSTLALLRTRAFAAPSGRSVVEEVITKTFFDLTFEPDIMIGPATLDFVSDFVSRHTSSLDTLYTILQLAHLKHFAEPFTVFVRSDERDIDLTHGDARAFVTRLTARFRESRIYGEDRVAASMTHVQEELLDSVNAARTAFRGRARRLRVGFAVAEVVRHISKAAVGGMDEGSSLKFASAVLRGRAEKDFRQLGLVLKKMSAGHLRALLEQLLALSERVGGDCAELEEQTLHGNLEVALIALTRIQEGENGDTNTGANPSTRDVAQRKLAEQMGGWLTRFLEQCFVRLDEGLLWDVWYMGNTPFPAELIDPAPRLSVVSALMHPEDFVQAHSELRRESLPLPLSPSPRADSIRNADLDVGLALGQAHTDREEEKAPALWQLPDTSILFRRYAEAGRMVNVYDWFQSFAVVLDSQRRHLRRCERRGQDGNDEQQAGRADVNGVPRMNGVGTRFGKGKGKQRVVLEIEADGEEDDVDGSSDSDEDDENGGEEGEDSEEWREEVHARFMRALHTLDYMGFVRHTGRKADHIIRTIHDVLD